MVANSGSYLYSSFTDAGYAIRWRKSTLNAGADWFLESIEQITTGGII